MNYHLGAHIFDRVVAFPRTELQASQLGESLEGRCGENVPWDQRSDQAYVLVDNVWQLDAFEAEFGSNIWNELGSEIGIDFVVDVDTRNVVGTPLMSTDDLDARGKRDEIRHSKVLM